MLRITDESSVPEMRTRSILFIRSDIKIECVSILEEVQFCIPTTKCVSLLMYKIVPEGTCSHKLYADLGGFVVFWEHPIFLLLKLIKDVILWVYTTIPVGFTSLCIILAIFWPFYSLVEIIPKALHSD